MSNFAPTITNITPGSWTFAAMLTAIHDHINTTSTLWDIELLAAGGSGDGFVLRPTTAGQSFSICLRNNTTTLACIRTGIQPGASGIITAVGDATTIPSGTNSDWSSEVNWLATTNMTAGAKLYICEFYDAIFVLTIGSAGNVWNNCLHAGRIYNPFYPTVQSTLGRDGLGILVNAPISTNGPNSFFTNSGTGSGMVHIATGKWLYPANFGLNSSAGHDAIATVGFVMPYPVPMYFNVSGVASPFMVGFSRYVMIRGNTAAPLVRLDLDNTTDEAWITGGSANSTTVTNMILPWRRSVTP
jgi:hypothetical protein